MNRVEPVPTLLYCSIMSKSVSLSLFLKRVALLRFSVRFLSQPCWLSVRRRIQPGNFIHPYNLEIFRFLYGPLSLLSSLLDRTKNMILSFYCRSCPANFSRLIWILKIDVFHPSSVRHASVFFVGYRRRISISALPMLAKGGAIVTLQTHCSSIPGDLLLARIIEASWSRRGTRSLED